MDRSIIALIFITMFIAISCENTNAPISINVDRDTLIFGDEIQDWSCCDSTIAVLFEDGRYVICNIDGSVIVNGETKISIYSKIEIIPYANMFSIDYSIYEPNIFARYADKWLWIKTILGFKSGIEFRDINNGDMIYEYHFRGNNTDYDVDTRNHIISLLDYYDGKETLEIRDIINNRLLFKDELSREAYQVATRRDTIYVFQGNGIFYRYYYGKDNSVHKINPIWYPLKDDNIVIPMYYCDNEKTIIVYNDTINYDYGGVLFVNIDSLYSKVDQFQAKIREWPPAMYYWPYSDTIFVDMGKYLGIYGINNDELKMFNVAGCVRADYIRQTRFRSDGIFIIEPIIGDEPSYKLVLMNFDKCTGIRWPTL